MKIKYLLLCHKTQLTNKQAIWVDTSSKKIYSGKLSTQKVYWTSYATGKLQIKTAKYNHTPKEWLKSETLTTQNTGENMKQ